MADFYFKALANDHLTYIYYYEAPDQETADEFIATDPEVLEWESIQAKDVPPYMINGPS